ncbi:MAG: type II toxin-antitoxin system RelE/ParE family toxin [bacterium]|jgi:plasmid stabilization system protein ParE|nr:type II toxin-antitoxin system RelE/ParE family toxin [bacterium]
MKVRITKPAQRRLRQIDDYYRKKGNRSHVTKLKKDIKKKSELLSQNPELGQEEDYLKELGQGHRYVIVTKLYKLIYLVAAPFIFITDVFDTRQNPNDMHP